jgi:predicted ATPase
MANLCDRLYGRAREVALLHDIYSSVVNLESDTVDVDTLGTITTSRRSAFILLCGDQGVGKRELAWSLRPHVQATGGLFLMSRCRGDQTSTQSTRCNDSSRDCPPRPLEAIRQALAAIFTTGNDTKGQDDLKAAVREEFPDPNDVESLTEIFGSVTEEWFYRDLGRQHPESTNGSAILQPPLSRTTRTPLLAELQIFHKERLVLLERLVRVIVSFRPVVLLLERIELSDRASMELLSSLIKKMGTSKVKGLLLVATCREENTELLKSTLTVNESVFHRLHIKNLAWDNVYQWTRDAVKPNEYTEEFILTLADLVQIKSRGNPQMVWYLLSSLSSSNRLSSDDALIDQYFSNIPSNISNMYARTIQEQPAGVQSVVELVAALEQCNKHGQDRYPISVSLVEMVLQRPCSDDIFMAQQYRILMDMMKSPSFGELCFASSEFQAVAYSIIPESRRATLHSMIGRQIWKHSPLRTLDHEGPHSASFLNLIAESLHRGGVTVTDEEEIKVLITIRLLAGQLAMQSSDFVLAALHFELAIATLGHRLWQAEWYDLSLVLHNRGSEACYCIADFDKMTGLCDAVLMHAKTFQDKLQVYCTLVYSNGVRNNLKEAFRMAFHLLRELGQAFPSNPGVLTVGIEFLKTRAALRKKTKRFLLGLPAATDINVHAVTQLLNFAILYSYVAQPEVGMLAVFRMIRLVLVHGMTAPAVTAFGMYGFFQCSALGKIEEGIRFGQISLELLEQNENQAWLPRVYFVAHSMVNRWAQPFRESLEPLLFAYKYALKTGDMEGSVLNSTAYLVMSFHCGKPLALLESEGRSFCEEMDRLRQKIGMVFMVPK